MNFGIMNLSSLNWIFLVLVVPNNVVHPKIDQVTHISTHILLCLNFFNSLVKRKWNTMLKTLLPGESRFEP